MQNHAKIFKALGEVNRLEILERLKSGEQCACHLLEDLNITQSTLSHHMKVLAEAGIVNLRKEGKWMYYGISPVAIDRTQNLLATFQTKEVPHAH